MPRDGYEADQVFLMCADVIAPQEGEGQAANPAVANIRNLTAGFKYNVDGAVWMGDSRGFYFSSLTEGLGAIYRIAVSGEGLERITPEDAWYDFHCPFGETQDGMLLTSYASMEFPTELVAVAVPGRPGSRMEGLTVRLSHENDRILSQLTPHKTEARWIDTVDGQKMLTWVLLPPGFDPSKTYPAIEICLGGPQGTLSQEWSYRWNYLLMCHQGYVVVLPNRRRPAVVRADFRRLHRSQHAGLPQRGPHDQEGALHR